MGGVGRPALRALGMLAPPVFPWTSLINRQNTQDYVHIEVRVWLTGARERPYRNLHTIELLLKDGEVRPEI